MAKCVACARFLSSSGAVTCMTCPCIFHKVCVAIPDNVSVAQDWICPECKRKQRKGDNSATPVRSICNSTVPLPPCNNAVISNSPPPVAALTPSASSVGETDVRDMRREMGEYMAELREFRKEFRASMASIGERMDGLERRLEILEQREVVPIMNDEVTELQQMVLQLKLELHDRDQEVLLTDLDIRQVPEKKGENILHTVIVLAKKLGVTMEDRDIVFAERVGSLGASATGDTGVVGRPRPVVVRLARRHLRDEFLRAARVRRNLTTVDIGVAGPSRRVYINERLTRNNRQLFYRVREECRKRQWRYSWTRRGRVFARQNDGKQVYLIRSEADFERVFESSSV